MKKENKELLLICVFLYNFFLIKISFIFYFFDKRLSEVVVKASRWSHVMGPIEPSITFTQTDSSAFVESLRDWEL